jgi:hypothetical protein
MKQFRPRLTESEYKYIYNRREQREGIYKVIFLSDTHGWLLDKSVYSCFLEILKENEFNEICINGDLADFPYLSNHTAKLYEDGILRGYTEIGEIEFTKHNILKPLLELAPTAKRRIRLGNHDERITSPKKYNQLQLERLLDIQRHYNTASYAEMLGLKGMNFTYDPTPATSYFNIFDAVHGLSLAKNASEKNIYEYMGSGTTGHTHRANTKFLTNIKGQYGWMESGCMRHIKEVEYFPTGKVADWQNSFIEVIFDLREEKPIFLGTSHLIIDGKCKYNGVIYDGKTTQL